MGVHRRAAAIALLFAVAGCGAGLRPTGSWRELRSQHFVLATTIDEAAARAETARLEQALAALAARLRPGRPLPARIDVLWLRASSEVAALGVDADGYYLPHQPEEPSSPPVIVVGGKPGVTTDGRLLHELTHALAADALPHAPSWVAEGLAGYYATLGVVDNDARLANLAVRQGARSESRSDGETHHYTLLPLTQLLNATDELFHSEWNAGSLYGSARDLVALLASDPALQPRFARFLLRLGEDAPAASAWQQAFGDLPLSTLEESYQQFAGSHATRVALPEWAGTLATQTLPPAAVERWLARARPWDSREALVAAGAALARAGADDSADCHYWAGVLALRWRHFAAALVELRAALALAPDHEPAAWATARALMSIPTATTDERRAAVAHLATIAHTPAALDFVAHAQQQLGVE